MESNLVTLPTTNSMMNSEPLSKTCNPEDLGLVVRYDTISYRGYEINFLSDVTGVQCFGQWQGDLVDLGLSNIYYKEDMCKFVDYKLDLISDFRDCPSFVGARLEYFNNGGHRDIRLSYRGRVLKIFIVVGQVNETLLITESKLILHNSGLLE